MISTSMTARTTSHLSRAMRRAPAAIVTCLVLIAAAMPAFAGEPTDVVKARTQDVAGVLVKPDSAKREKELDQALKKSVDFRELAARSLKGYWEKQPADQQQIFLDLLQRMLEANYTAKLSGKRLDKDYKIEYVKERERGELAVVKTMVAFDGDRRPVDYKLLKRPGDKEWTVFDIVIDDISLEETYRESYTEIIRAEGWDSLIKRMKDKAEELETADKKSK